MSKKKLPQGDHRDRLLTALAAVEKVNNPFLIESIKAELEGREPVHIFPKLHPEIMELFPNLWPEQ